MNQMSEFVLLTDMQTELGRIGLVLIENTSKPRLHFGGAVHLENAVVQQGCQALWKFLKWSMNTLQFLHFKIRIHVDVWAKHIMWLLIRRRDDHLELILSLLHRESQPCYLIWALGAVERLALDLHRFGGNFSWINQFLSGTSHFIGDLFCHIAQSDFLNFINIVFEVFYVLV